MECVELCIGWKPLAVLSVTGSCAEVVLDRVQLQVCLSDGTRRLTGFRQTYFKSFLSKFLVPMLQNFFLREWFKKTNSIFT